MGRASAYALGLSCRDDDNFKATARQARQSLAWMDRILMRVDPATIKSGQVWPVLFGLATEETGLSRAEVIAHSRKADVVAARRVLFAVAWGWLDWSLPRTGRVFGLSHHAVLYGVQTMAALRNWPSDQHGFRQAMGQHVRALRASAGVPVAGAALSPASLQRHVFIDHMLKAAGFVGHIDVRRVFGVAPEQAKRDLRRFYHDNPGRMAWDDDLVAYRALREGCVYGWDLRQPVLAFLKASGCLRGNLLIDKKDG